MNAALLLGTLVTIAVLARMRLLVHGGQLPALADLRGVLSDLGVASLLVLGLQVLRAGWRRWMAGGVLLGFVLLSHTNAEHVVTLGSEADYRNAAYLLTPTFLKGSAMKSAASPWLAVLLVAAGLGFWLSLRETAKKMRAVPLLAAGVALLGMVAWPVQYEKHSWRQRNLVETNAALAMHRIASGTADELVLRPEIQQAFRPDLSGRPMVMATGERRNVLLVFVEGATGGYLPSVAAWHGIDSPIDMPRLDRLGGERGLRYTRVFHQQRQSNRGNYAMLCGDFPSLASGTPKLLAVAHGGGARCLPRILADHGYHTAFYHPTNLQFMSFGPFARAAGFEDVLGGEAFEDAYARSRWGPDDKAFFESSARRIVELHDRDEPFLVTLFTTGTHHPYAVPGSFEAPGAASQQARAFAYSDEAVAELIATLAEQGVLDDTLVILTSEEAAGVPMSGRDLQQTLTQNWAPMVVLTPEGHAGHVGEPYLVSDVALSILDYLGLASAAPHFVGRSMFRSYEWPRVLSLANTYFRTASLLYPDGRLLQCRLAGGGCTAHRLDPVRTFGGEVRAVDGPVSDDLLRGFVAASRRPPSAGEHDTLDFRPAQRVVVTPDEGGTMLFGGQYLDLAADKVLEVELDLEVVRGAAWFEARLGRLGDLIHEFRLLPVDAGGRLGVKLAFVPDEPHRRVEWNLVVHPIGGQPVEIEFDAARLSLVDRGEQPPGLRVREFDHDPLRDSTRLLEMSASSLEWQCAEQCRGELPLELPTVQQREVIVLADLQGRYDGSRVRAELWRGSERLGRSQPVELSRGGSARLGFSADIEGVDGPWRLVVAVESEESGTIPPVDLGAIVVHGWHDT